MAEPPTKRAKRTDSAAMWDKNESTTAPKPQRPSEDSRGSKRNDTEQGSLSEARNRRHDDERRDETRRRSRSRDRYRSRRERSRSRERPLQDRDRDRDRDRMRDDRRNRDRERERDQRGSGRGERSQSPYRQESSKGVFKASPEDSNTFD